MNERKSESRRTIEIPENFSDLLVPAWTMSQCPDPILGAVLRYYSARYFMSRVSIPALSKTANKAWRMGKGKMFLHPDIAVIKKMVRKSIDEKNPEWGICLANVLARRFAVVAVFESTKWTCSDGSIWQNRDVDNRVKTMMDALVAACVKVNPQCNDSNAWQIHAFKLQSFEERSTLFVFDLSREKIPRVGEANGTLL